MDLITFGNKYPFLQANLDFWKKYLAARDAVWRLLPSVLDETALEQSDFLSHLAEEKPFLAYASIRIAKADMEKLMAAFCSPFELAVPQTGLPEEIPVFEKLTVSPDETGFVIAELHSLIASYIESIITSAEEEAINWLDLHCPICGAGAGMGILAPSGKKNLVCSHCQTLWAYPRINCGLCGHIEERGATFYTADEEPNWLIETCKECKSYLKVYDMRKALPDILTYPLHYLTSWNLDLTMRDKEFVPQLFHIFERAGWIKAKH